jgi:uncharacterized membrane protein YdcZ (DUF606 family)
LGFEVEKGGPAMNGDFYILFLSFLLGTMKVFSIGYWSCGSTHSLTAVLEMALWPLIVGLFGLAFATATLKHCQH